MSTQHSVQSLLLEIKALQSTDPTVLNTLIARAHEPRPLTRDEGESDHFCSMVAPIVAAKKLIYIGRHIKSGLWIPPGGHIDKGETPHQTAVRECQEELKAVVSAEDLHSLGATVADIVGRAYCTKHYDFWFMWQLANTQPFTYDPNEFHEAGWHPIDWAINACKHTAYASVLRIIKQHMLQ